MPNWWHRLWCRDCRDVRPFEVCAYPNEYPLYEPFFAYVRWNSPACRIAQTLAQSNEGAALRHLAHT